MPSTMAEYSTDASTPMDLTEAVARIYIAVKKQEPTWLKFPPNQRRPARLYHYTSQAGLLAILSSKVLWASNILYLNDASESRYGISVAREKFRILQRNRPNQIVREFLKEAEGFLDLAKLVPRKHFYACCFCREPDLLSQWRAYASRGVGYSIGFDTKDLTSAVLKRDYSLFPIEYGARATNSRLLTKDLGTLCHAVELCVERWPMHKEVLVSAACGPASKKAL